MEGGGGQGLAWPVLHISLLFINRPSLTEFSVLISSLYVVLPKDLRIYYSEIILDSFLFLFYPITLEGHRGTTDEFATIPIHLVRFSAALVELAKSIPVHCLILSSHLFFCLPLFLFPFTVPCRIFFA